MGICDRLCSSCFGDFYLWTCRLFGLATAVVLWGISIETSFYGHYLGYILLVFALLVTFLEVVFAVSSCIAVCCSVDSCFKTCWDCVLWLDDWKKSIAYLILSIPCFIQPTEVWLAIIGGIMLILCATLNLFKTFKTNVDRDRKTLAQTPSYDKFEEIQEIVDEDEDDVHVITQPGTMAIVDDDIGDQQEILEV